MHSLQGQDSSSVKPISSHQKISVRWAVVPSVLVGYGMYVYGHHGFYSSYDSYRDIQLHFPTFHSSIDNVTQFVPPLTIVGLHLAGMKGKNPSLDVAGLYATSLLATTLIVQGLKYSVHELRPDGSAYNSFPSGHTATAFVGAEMLHQEYGKKSVWFSIAAYGMATFTGTLRMLNNRHWQSDVLVGAGIGMLSTKCTYLAHAWCRKKKNKKFIY